MWYIGTCYIKKDKQTCLPEIYMGRKRTTRMSNASRLRMRFGFGSWFGSRFGSWFGTWFRSWFGSWFGSRFGSWFGSWFWNRLGSWFGSQFGNWFNSQRRFNSKFLLKRKVINDNVVDRHKHVITYYMYTSAILTCRMILATSGPTDSTFMNTFNSVSSLFSGLWSSVTYSLHSSATMLAC